MVQSVLLAHTNTRWDYARIDDLLMNDISLMIAILNLTYAAAAPATAASVAAAAAVDADVAWSPGPGCLGCSRGLSRQSLVARQLQETKMSCFFFRFAL